MAYPYIDKNQFDEGMRKLQQIQNQNSPFSTDELDKFMKLMNEPYPQKRSDSRLTANEIYEIEKNKASARMNLLANPIMGNEKPPIVAEYKKPSWFSNFTGHIISASIVGLLSYFAADKDIIVRTISAINPPSIVYTNVIVKSMTLESEYPHDLEVFTFSSMNQLASGKQVLQDFKVFRRDNLNRSFLYYTNSW